MSAQTDIAAILWLTADELEKLHGPHPTVSTDEAKRVAREVINRSHFLNKDKLITAVEYHIEKSFGQARK